ncbi:hypothetical protein EDEG_00559 [Edhazardia aedis USNM 41457]|uniref:Uncharacterized protein n=1 Tax=Edhazardia aedis (strain USNM 41457) TaxID=1003232 RepID=J9D033_EDHAE|nr:hypothetical protein EDEG_00559 [Edhazardia aedis USNM 41457]|eukprot:EJW01226.1 hypothetical protein EDEG_00559 [Edhazardia aedis USNM 41457]
MEERNILKEFEKDDLINAQNCIYKSKKPNEIRKLLYKILDLCSRNLDFLVLINLNKLKVKCFINAFVEFSTLMELFGQNIHDFLCDNKILLFIANIFFEYIKKFNACNNKDETSSDESNLEKIIEDHNFLDVSSVNINDEKGVKNKLNRNDLILIDFLDDERIVQICRVLELALSHKKKEILIEKMNAIGFFYLLPIISTVEVVAIYANIFKYTLYHNSLFDSNAEEKVLSPGKTNSCIEVNTLDNKADTRIKIIKNCYMKTPVMEIKRLFLDSEIIVRNKPVFIYRSFNESFIYIKRYSYLKIADNFLKNVHFYILNCGIVKLIDPINFYISHHRKDYETKQLQGFFRQILTLENFKEISEKILQDLQMNDLKLLFYIMEYLLYSKSDQIWFILSKIVKNCDFFVQLIGVFEKTKNIEELCELVSIIFLYLKCDDRYNKHISKNKNTPVLERINSKKYIRKIFNLLRYKKCNYNHILGLILILYEKCEKKVFFVPSILLLMYKIVLEKNYGFAMVFFKDYKNYLNSNFNNISKTLFPLQNINNSMSKSKSDYEKLEDKQNIEYDYCKTSSDDIF